MKCESFGITDKGIVRDQNEDAFLANEQDGLFLVADGMGGLSKGAVASKIAVETIEHSRQISPRESSQPRISI